jgi:ABC-type antimicrobial peptide transport system permease subunit
VVERRKEVGIRLALGGTRLGVWWTVARASLEAVMAGVAAGGMAAALADTALAAMLPELRGTNWIFGVVAGGVLFAVAAAAAMTAARGATSVEPVRALAGE